MVIRSPDASCSPPLHDLLHLPRCNIYPHELDPDIPAASAKLCWKHGSSSKASLQVISHGRQYWQIRQRILRRFHDACRESRDFPVVPCPSFGHPLHQGLLDPSGHLHGLLQGEVLSEHLRSRSDRTVQGQGRRHDGEPEHAAICSASLGDGQGLDETGDRRYEHEPILRRHWCASPEESPVDGEVAVFRFARISVCRLSANRQTSVRASRAGQCFDTI